MTSKRRNVSAADSILNEPPHRKKTARTAPGNSSQKIHRRQGLRFAALDLGTNNCRLLIAAPSKNGLRIVDAFSRIVRLGEGLTQTGMLSQDAMARTREALIICAEKIKRRGVSHMRCIATQACRAAGNGATFLDSIETETGLTFDIISTKEEARLAASGCAELLDPNVSAGLVFDIGGGSTEISWMRKLHDKHEVVAWTSLSFGVVTLSENWGGREIDRATYRAIIEKIRHEIRAVGDPAGLQHFFQNDDAHVLGTSGTVTSIAGVFLGLKRYRRDKVDGLWLDSKEALATAIRLQTMNFEERAKEPCIGRDRADLVVCGCAILEALLLEWPSSRIRVADRGLREGILADLAEQAGRA
ncbi:Ppx/GppA phosphatase family protein [Hyphococcus sp.]|uniref:Ppx/GppA phosphatase family protein n=1 Tax=Hyphococcus sp. TaxID=2038636 RepID=UPI003CCC459A